MSKIEVPNLNKEIFPPWKGLMKIHLGGLGDYAQTTIFVEHVDPVGATIVEDLKRRKSTIMQCWRLHLP